MKIATNALVTLLIVTLLTFSVPIVNTSGTSHPPNDRSGKRLGKVLNRHDKKMEIRASVLGISADELKQELQTKPFDSVIKHYGFKNIDAFQKALVGKLKDELKHRGWTDRKINQYLAKRVDRLNRA